MGNALIWVVCVFLLISCGQKKESLETETGIRVNVTPEAAFHDGRRQFHIRKCAECHGPLGKGGNTGTESPVLKDYERPMDFTLRADEWRDSSLDRGILRMAQFLRTGPPNAHPDLEHDYRFFTDEELIHLSLYVNFLMENTSNPEITSPPDFSAEELARLREELKQTRLEKSL